MGLRDQAQTFASRDCEIIGVSYDSPEDNRLFAEKFDFPFRLLSDTDRSVSAAYGVQRAEDDPYPDFPRRISYLVDAEGTVVKRYEVTDPAGHALEVLRDLPTADGDPGTTP